jgi:hypothetical protein
MTKKSMMLTGRIVALEEAGTVHDSLGTERLVVLDDVVPRQEMMGELDGIRWVIRSRDRLSGMAGRPGYVSALKGCSGMDNVMYAHVDEEICEVVGGVVGDSVWHLPDVHSPLSSEHIEHLDVAIGMTNELDGGELNVGCFGQGGNVMAQAAAAIMLSESMGVRVSFHFSRCGDDEVGNIKGMFQEGAGCVIHGEMNREQRYQIMSFMDVGMQVGARPEKNIVSDYVEMGIPVVTGESEEWLPVWTADAESPRDICSKATSALRWRSLGVPLGRFLLERERVRSIEKWDIFFEGSGLV